MMAGKKIVELNTNLIKTKGEAKPAEAVPQRAGRSEVGAGDPTSEALNFKVPRSFKKDFKQAALNADLKQVELLTAMFDLWKQHHAA